MRVALARFLAFARSTSHTAITGAEELAAIVTKVFDYNLSNLKLAQGKLDFASVDRAVAVLAAAARRSNPTRCS